MGVGHGKSSEKAFDSSSHAINALSCKVSYMSLIQGKGAQEKRRGAPTSCRSIEKLT